jgi:hypothetical protein
MTYVVGASMNGKKNCAVGALPPRPQRQIGATLSRPEGMLAPCSLAPSFRRASVLKCVGVRTTSLITLGQPKFESHRKLNIRYLMESSIKKSDWVIVYGMVSFFLDVLAPRGEI